MYWNERFDLDDLCVQFPLDTLSRNNVKNDILLLFKKYLSNSERPDDIFNRLQLSQGSIGVCRVIWPNETVLFKCNDCQYDSTCAICINCFLNSSHMGHSWSMSKSYGGCCDCGDSSSWKLSGSCHRHQGVTHRQDGPRSLVSFTYKFYTRSLGLIADIIAFIDRHLLTVSSAQHKFSAILLDILKEFANLLHGLRWIISNNISYKILCRWIKRHKDLDLSLQKSFGLFYLAMFASPKFKIKFSKIFARNYISIITPFPNLLYDNIIFSMTELSVQLFTVPEIAISLSKTGFLYTCLQHLKKLFKILTFSSITHSEFIANGFLHECIQICADLSFLLNHKEVSRLVIEDSELHCELFNMLSSYNYVNSQVLQVERHIDIQNTLYPLTFIIEDRIVNAIRPLWLNFNMSKDEFSPSTLWKVYENYFKSLVADMEISKGLQSKGTDDDIYLCRTFHIPLMRLLPNIIHMDKIKSLLKVQSSYTDAGYNNENDKFLDLIHKSMLHVLDQCIRCHLFYLEIKGEIWVRNGDSMFGQNEKYKNMGFLDRDVAVMQMAALIINLLPKQYTNYNFLQILAANCFPYIEKYDNISDFSAKLTLEQQFTHAFDRHYYKYLECSFKWFFIILCRYLSNVVQLISYNWDFSSPLIDVTYNTQSKLIPVAIDTDINYVKYSLFKIDLIHYIHFNSTKITDLVKYAERRWPNGDLFKALEQIGTIRRYGNGSADVTLKSKYLCLIDIYWPGDFTIFDENAATNNTNSHNADVINVFPQSYTLLHNEVKHSIYPDLAQLLQSLNTLRRRFTLPNCQMQIIAREISKIDPLNTSLDRLINTFDIASVDTKTKDSFDSTMNSPKRSVQTEALSNLKRKQLSFLATLNESDESDLDDEISAYCILCHSSGKLILLCYQLPMSKLCKHPTLNNFYPLFRCIETCGHVIHQKCLETYVANRRYSDKKTFPCPLCKLQVNLTIPYIHESSNMSDEDYADTRDVLKVTYVSNAFVASYWELLVTTSFKRNLLISNHATMLCQLMKHQYKGTIKSVPTSNNENCGMDCGLWKVNPIANLIQFIFTGKPSKDSILAHIRKLSYIVIVQLLLDDYITHQRAQCEIESETSLEGGDRYFRLKRYFKNILSLRKKICTNQDNVTDSFSAVDKNFGFKIVKMVVYIVKINLIGTQRNRKEELSANFGLTFDLISSDVKVEMYKSNQEIAESRINTDFFLPTLHKLLELTNEPNCDIISILCELYTSHGNKLLSKLCDFISVCLWSLHCIFAYKPQVIKKFSHEHLIGNQLDRFTLLWNFVADDKSRIDDFRDIVMKAINHITDVTSERYRPKFSLKMFKLARNSEIIPRDYMKLLRNTMNIKCLLCNNKPLSPAVCLFCCRWICLYCKEGDKYMGAFDHASRCSFGCGCLFLVHQRKVLYVCSYTKRHAYVDSIYNGPFGTFRENFTSNSPLELSRSRLVTIANDLFFNRRSIKWQRTRSNLLNEEGED